MNSYLFQPQYFLGVLRPIHDSCVLPWCPSYQMREIILCSVGKGLHLPLTLIKMVLKWYKNSLDKIFEYPLKLLHIWKGSIEAIFTGKLITTTNTILNHCSTLQLCINDAKLTWMCRNLSSVNIQDGINKNLWQNKLRSEQFNAIISCEKCKISN